MGESQGVPGLPECRRLEILWMFIEVTKNDHSIPVEICECRKAHASVLAGRFLVLGGIVGNGRQIAKAHGDQEG